MNRFEVLLFLGAAACVGVAFLVIIGLVIWMFVEVVKLSRET